MAAFLRNALPALFAISFAVLVPPAHATHVACGDTLTQDTTLDSDLLDCPRDGVTLEPGVTLDLAGHVIDGTGAGVGVRARDDQATVHDGTVREFGSGLFTDEARFLLHGMRIVSNGTGIEAYGGGGELRDSIVAHNRVGTWEVSPIVRSRFTGNTEVAMLISEGVGTITDNVVRGNGAGILVGEGDGTVARNVVTDNPGRGINWHFSGAGAIRDNLVARNGTGISVETFAHPAVEGNVIRNNASHGFAGRWSDDVGSRVVGNTIERNGGHGVFVTGSGPCPEVRGNDVARNGRDGIFLEDRSDSLGCERPVVDNSARQNAADGIHVADNMGPVVLQGNRALHNGEDGIDVDPQGAFSTTPVWSPDGQRIAFSAEPAAGALPGGPGLYVSRPDGSALSRLAAGEHPDWSPDGQRIAFASRTTDLGVYTIRPDGGDLGKLAPSTSRPSRPDWSPDGQTIVYDDAGTIWSAPPAGGTPQALTSGTPANDPEWSPDGSRILFESHPFILGDGNIYVTPAGGGPRTFVATGQDATWSPDGDHIVFAHQGDLFVINPDGTGLRQLTSGAPGDSRPSVSPDGTAVAFMRSSAESGLYTVGLDGSGPARIAPSQEHTGGQGPPSWSPDSARITFDVDGRLWVVARDGSGLRRLTLDTNPLVTLTANVADHNRDLGIEAVAGVVDGGGNRARHNGDRRQCVNVSC